MNYRTARICKTSPTWEVHNQQLIISSVNACVGDTNNQRCTRTRTHNGIFSVLDKEKHQSKFTKPSIQILIIFAMPLPF